MTVGSTPRSRRAILAASLGGVAALAANAIGRVAPVSAADGQAVLVGGDYQSSSRTLIQNVTGGDPAIVGVGGVNGQGIYGGVTDSGTGVFGLSSGSGTGVMGRSTSGTAVDGWAHSSSATGLIGRSGGDYLNPPLASGVFGHAPDIGVYGAATETTHETWGVFGTTESPTGRGVRGDSLAASGGCGVFGYGAGAGARGVIGQATQDADSFGVYGLAADGRGVFGLATSGQGVRGEATNGRGIHGQATTGMGVRGYATTGVGLSGEATTGYALRTKGRVRFDNSSGLATIASGTSSIVVTPGIDLTSTSAVVATLQGNAGGSTSVKRIAVNATNNTFTIYLTANSTASVKAAWHVFG